MLPVVVEGNATVIPAVPVVVYSFKKTGFAALVGAAAPVPTLATTKLP